MIKVSVMYPNTQGGRFDHAHYKDRHMPMCKEKFGSACKRYSIDRGVAGGAPGAPATYVAMWHFYFDSVPAFQAAFAPHAKAVLDDVPRFTDLSPVIQISEVVVE